MNVAIIGCGKVADAHAEIIRGIPGCAIIATCDNEELMARQMHERLKTKYWFTDANKLLQEAKPDVVHITTPPQSHYSLGKLCLEAGCNIYVEKPFTLNTQEAEELINLGTDKNLKITVGTNIQYSHVAQRVRDLVKNGFLGGPPTHVESIFCYSLKDDFARAFLGDKNHWVRKLPGKLLHNIISHGIARIAEYLSDDDPQVIAKGFSSKAIRDLGGGDIIDELRVTIIDSKGTTAYFTFSSQICPLIHQFRLYGPRKSIIVDDDHQIVLKSNAAGYKSYLNYFIPPLLLGRQYFSNARHNVAAFIGRKLYMDSGKTDLIRSFYHSISDNAPPPIPYAEILRTSRILDRIFNQIYSG